MLQHFCTKKRGEQFSLWYVYVIVSVLFKVLLFSFSLLFFVHFFVDLVAFLWRSQEIESFMQFNISTVLQRTRLYFIGWKKIWLGDHFRAIFIPATWFRRLILTICSRKWFNLTKFTRYQNLLCSTPLSEIPKKVWILSIRKEYNFMLFYILIINYLYMYSMENTLDYNWYFFWKNSSLSIRFSFFFISLN